MVVTMTGDAYDAYDASHGLDFSCIAALIMRIGFWAP